jgi:hypothetical protein
MSNLSGNLRTMPLSDILQWIESGRKTGTLGLTRRSIEKRIVFSDGRIHSSWSNDPRESLGQFLVRDGHVTEEQLFKGLLRQESEKRLLGSILVTDGVLPEDELKATLRLKAEETIYDLFLWPEGHFEFHEGEIPYDVLVHLDLDIREVVFEGMRRVDDWNRIHAVFPSNRVAFHRLETAETPNDPIERQALELAAAGKSMAEIGLELRRSEYETAVILFELKARDLIAIERAPDELSAQDPIGAVNELLTLAYARLQERRYDAAERAYHDVLALDRLNQNAKKGLLTLADARARDRATRNVPLDQVPCLNKDLLALTRENLDPQEGFVLSRVNGEWDVRSILKLCPLPEDEVVLIFSRLLDRGVIRLK